MRTSAAITHAKERVPKVEVVRVHVEITQEVIRVCLRDVGPVEVEREKHDESPQRDAPVNLADHTLIKGAA